MINVLDETKQQQLIALGRLGWSLRRIDGAKGARRETVSGYLMKAAGVATTPGRTARSVCVASKHYWRGRVPCGLRQTDVAVAVRASWQSASLLASIPTSPVGRSDYLARSRQNHNASPPENQKYAARALLTAPYRIKPVKPITSPVPDSIAAFIDHHVRPSPPINAGTDVVSFAIACWRITFFRSPTMYVAIVFANSSGQPSFHSDFITSAAE